MLCEQCQQNQSIVLLTERVSEGVTRRQLCGACAEPLLAEVKPDQILGATFLEAPKFRNNALPDSVELGETVSVSDLAAALGLRPVQVIGSLMRLEVFVSAKDSIDFATAAQLCSRYGVIPRPVCIA